MIPAADLAALITALALLLGALWQGARTRAEVAIMRRQMAPNGGATLRDAIDRTERRVAELAASIGGIRDDHRITREAVTALQRDATATHAAIHDRLDAIDRRLP